jgi:predicted NBD/HSP70 family sugar kinase
MSLSAGPDRSTAADMDGRTSDAVGTLLSLVAHGTATSRAELARVTGLARSTVSQRVDSLLARNLLVERKGAPSMSGRPPMVLSLHPSVGLNLAADIGATHARLAVAQVSGEILSELSMDLDIAAGPESVLESVDAGFEHLLSEVDRTRDGVQAIAIGVPGPVEFSNGVVVRPPIMPGWDGYKVPAFFSPRYQASVVVDNDVNVMALGEYWDRQSDSDYLLFVKVGTGIGCGIVGHGRLHRGAQGAAGDIGHIQLAGNADTICHCGNTGCLEAVASVAAIVGNLRAADMDVTTSRDVLRLAEEGNHLARRAIRLASHQIAEVLASVVNFYNPDLIVIGGPLAEPRGDLLAGIRAGVYRRALPLATKSIRIETSTLGDRAGVVGAVALARAQMLSPTGVRYLLRSHNRRGAGT